LDFFSGLLAGLSALSITGFHSILDRLSKLLDELLDDKVVEDSLNILTSLKKIVKKKYQDDYFTD
jgi:hypothetical protein